jgi:hypothetical protein
MPEDRSRDNFKHLSLIITGQRKMFTLCVNSATNILDLSHDHVNVNLLFSFHLCDNHNIKLTTF